MSNILTGEVVVVLLTAVVSPVVMTAVKYYYDKRTKLDEKSLTSTTPSTGDKGTEVDPIMDLTKHPFFERVKFLETTIKYNFTLPNKGKELITRDVLLNKFKAFSDNYMTACQSVMDNPDMPEHEFYALTMKAFNDSVVAYSTYYKDGGYTEDEIACLEIFLGKFNKWHDDRATSTTDCLQMMANSRFYYNNYAKMAASMDLLLGMMTATLYDAEKTLNELNGDLKGLTFKNTKL